MFKFLASITVILSIIYIPIIVYYVSLLQEREQIRAHVLAISIEVEPTPTPKISMLPEIVNRSFMEYGDDYAVIIKNLKTGEEYKFNENKKFNSASLYKLWIMAVAYQKIKESDLKEDQVLTGKLQAFDSALSAISPTPSPEGSTDPQISEEPKLISMSVKDAIDKMIIVSDNYAALLIASKVGTFSVTNFLKAYGFLNSNFRQPPQTNAEDIAMYYEKLYKGEIVDKEYSEKMMNILKRQTINDRIPANLPENTVIAHKTGELFGAKHDAGIVFSDKGDYIIVVLSDTKNPKVAVEKTANFSKEVYDYFEESI